MKKSSPADHYLQLEILRKLFISNKPLSFSQLKDDGIENSLFMYHMNKLISRKVVMKYEKCFKLTNSGVVWANNAGLDSLSPALSPKTLVQLLVLSNDETKILLGTRVGAASDLMNEMVLPGKLLEFAIPIQENAQKLANDLGLNSEVVSIGSYEFIRRHEDFTYHNLGFVFVVKPALSYSPKDTELYQYSWHEVDKIIDSKEDELLTTLLSTYKLERKINQVTLITNE